jgi:magnesium chelatase family protein
MTTTPLDELKVTREARDRIRAAIVNSGEKWPQMVTVSLPARLPSGSSADLTIAVSILAASGAVPAAALAGVVFVAELGLDGSLRPVPDVPAAITAAAEGGMHTVVVAAGDAADAALVPGTRLVVAGTLAEVAACCGSGHHDQVQDAGWLSR